MNKVVVIGCGHVGISYIQSLISEVSDVQEIYMIDTNESLLEAEYLDLLDFITLSSSDVHLYKGTYADCKDAKMVCITAGTSKSIKKRMDSLQDNNVIFSNILKNVLQSGFQGIYLVASNPLDIMCYLTYKYTDVNPYKVIGSGTLLDSARLQNELASYLKVNSKDIEAYVLGEHGDSQFVYWSGSTVALEPLDKMFTKEEKERIERRVREKGPYIAERKGYTSYGVGMALAKITHAIICDTHTVLPVCYYDSNSNCYYSRPAMIGKNGIISEVHLSLTEEEKNRLQQSIYTIQEGMKLVDNSY